MTDRRPDPDDARLHADLATWFEGEVRQAALDLRRAPLRPARARPATSRGIAAPVAGAILVSILVVAGITRFPSLAGPATETTGSAIPSSSVTASEPVAPVTPAPTGVIEGRYADGIPKVIDSEAVLRPSNIDDLGPADDSSFLLGGWSFDFLGFVYACPAIIGSPPPLGPVCGNQFLAETPVAFSEAPRVLLDGWTQVIPAGPVVLRVHVNDPLALRCAPAMREACAAMAVIEGVIWTGDDITATEPLLPIDAFERLAGVDPDLVTATLFAIGPVTLVRPEETIPLPSGIVRSGGLPCRDRYPQESWMSFDASLNYVLVFPSTSERVAADLGPRIGVNECPYLMDPGYRREWVAVENVMVGVRVGDEATTPAQADLVDDVRAALEGP